MGSKLVDEIITSTKGHDNAETGAYVCDDPGTVSTKWTELALATNP